MEIYPYFTSAFLGYGQMKISSRVLNLLDKYDNGMNTKNFYFSEDFPKNIQKID